MNKKIESKSEPRENTKKRRKMNAQQAAKMILDLPAPASNEKYLRQLGIEEKDYTMRVAIYAELSRKAKSGDVKAVRLLTQIAEELPEQLLAREKFEAEKKKLEDETTDAVKKLAVILDTITDGF
ncbi:MAG: hypothetical protein QM689_09240 [Oscillospiraceae bacterium]